MKAINITPEVYQLETKLLKDKNLKVAGYILDNALGKEQIQVFREEDSKLFWFENRDAAKYAVKFLTYHITRYLKLEYRDKDLNKYEEPEKVEVKEPEKVKEDLLNIVDIDDLKEFVKKYMKGYKIPAEFKKDELNEEEWKRFLKSLENSFTDGTQEIVNKIYGGKKAKYHDKNKMTADERKEYNLNNRQEFEWYLNNLIWVGKPSKKYLDQYGKFNTSNYLKVTADLRSIVLNSLIKYKKIF